MLQLFQAAYQHMAVNVGCPHVHRPHSALRTQTCAHIVSMLTRHRRLPTEESMHVTLGSCHLTTNRPTGPCTELQLRSTLYDQDATLCILSSFYVASPAAATYCCNLTAYQRSQGPVSQKCQMARQLCHPSLLHFTLMPHGCALRKPECKCMGKMLLCSAQRSNCKLL